MLSFRLSALNSTLVTPEVLSAWELAAFFLGEASVSTLLLDEDEARTHYIENFVNEAEKIDYSAEPHLADAEMMEVFENALIDQVCSRISELGDHYPFVLDSGNHLVRKSIQGIDSVGYCYLALQFFRGLAGSTIEIDGEDDVQVKKKKDAFDAQFRSVFEFIAGYAVSGDQNGAAYLLSDCRSAKKLEKKLGSVCRRIGSGSVTPIELWNLRQQAANDGGVDCMVHIGGPGVPGHAKIALIGATVQKARIDEKIIGPEKRDFFRSFFSNQPAAFHGVLVRVQDEDALTRDKCIQKDCLLYTYDQIWRSMGKRQGGAHQVSTLVRLDAKVRRLLDAFSDAVFLHEYEGFSLQSA